MKNDKIRILIVDDHTIVRIGLSALLNAQRDMTVVGEAEDGVQAVEKAVELKPDVVMMDLMLPGEDGASATKRICARVAGAKVLVLTSYADSADLRRALDNGAAGALLKDASDDELVAAIRSVAGGSRCVSDEVEKRIALCEPSFELTERQLEILRAASQGLSSQDIARCLGITRDGVTKHFTVIFQKLGVSNRSEAVALALRHQLLKL